MSEIFQTCRNNYLTSNNANGVNLLHWLLKFLMACTVWVQNFPNFLGLLFGNGQPLFSSTGKKNIFKLAYTKLPGHLMLTFLPPPQQTPSTDSFPYN